MGLAVAGLTLLCVLVVGIIINFLGKQPRSMPEYKPCKIQERHLDPLYRSVRNIEDDVR